MKELFSYIANLAVEDIFQCINNATKNSTYISTFSDEQFLKAVGNFLSNQIIIYLIAAGELMIPIDESADKADHLQRSIFVCFVDDFDSKLVLSIVNLTTCEGLIHKVYMLRDGDGWSS